jgi:hypothetical protein
MSAVQALGWFGSLFISLTLVGCTNGTGDSPASPPASSAGTIWASDASSIQNLQAVDAQTTQLVFDQPRNYISGPALGWQATTVRAYASAAAFATDVAHGSVPAGTTTVLYDPEQWSATPLTEQQQPSVFMAQFAQLAKTQRYSSIMTPAVNLMNVAGAECTAQTGEAAEDAFIRCNIAGKAAVADVVNIQWQRLEADATRYASYVATSAGQAKAVNPQVIFLTQLTTRTFDTQSMPTTGCLMYTAYLAARTSVQGFWLHVDPNNGQIGIDFLKLVEGTGGCP